MEKTNVMRILDQKKIDYNEYFYGDTPISGVEVAKVLNQDEKHVYKTLVTVSKSKKYYVFMIPVAEELDLKKCAKSVNEKSIDMLPQKELLPLTGYVHGGCSPIGMKKQFKTTINDTALNQDTIIFSAGRVGYQVELNPKDLEKVINLFYFDIIK
jgi:Cys-tRNA(Pro)/Cys-tRNA(Cys) deacylase